MSVPDPVMARLETQLEALSTILARATLNTIDQRPSSGDWSARENLAHLARRSVRKRWPWAFAVNVNCPRRSRRRSGEQPDRRQETDGAEGGGRGAYGDVRILPGYSTGFARSSSSPSACSSSPEPGRQQIPD